MNNNRIEELARLIWAQHHFKYNTIAEAKKIARVATYEYCFDALSLCVYYSNLSNTDQGKLNQCLNGLYNNQSNDIRKMHNEYISLFYYLSTSNNPFQDYRISKEERPDFILFGDKTIAIEVVEFTTEKNAILRNISRNNFGKGKTAEEIHQAAVEKHGTKAEKYDYCDLSGHTMISDKELSDTDKQFSLFAKNIYEKNRKYNSMFSEFDVFIVLCDGRNTIANQEDADDVIKRVKKLEIVSGFDISILYIGDNGIEQARYRL